MTQLANADLLDESVANSSSLKNKRLNRTAQTASNPNPAPINNSTTIPSPKTILKKVEEEEEDDELEMDDYETDSERQDFNYQRNQFIPNKAEKESSNDKKILGMKPIVFWGLLGVAAVGAYFGYKYLKKNNKLGFSNDKGLASSANSVATPPSANPEIKI